MDSLYGLMNRGNNILFPSDGSPQYLVLSATYDSIPKKAAAVNSFPEGFLSWRISRLLFMGVGKYCG